MALPCRVLSGGLGDPSDSGDPVGVTGYSTGADYEPHAEQHPFEDRVVEREVLRQALAMLSAEDAACILLSVVQAMHSSEIAQVLGISAEAVRKRVSRAKQRLRAAYFAQEKTSMEERPQ